MEKCHCLMAAMMLTLPLGQFNTFAQSTNQSYTFTTLAGSSPGSADGKGTAAQFWRPYGLTVDAQGNVFVTDTINDTIRKVTADGTVSTWAGQAGISGSTNGTGAAARFDGPSGPAVDSAGNVYVADSNNHLIRKITADGVVTTLAGKAGTFGHADGSGTAAQFYLPTSVAVDSVGKVYVADTANNSIRIITRNGQVTTLAGVAQFDLQGYPVGGSADGTPGIARFNEPFAVALDKEANVYVADAGNNTIRKVTPAGVVSTLAGKPQFDNKGNPVGGSVDGTGSAARFNFPAGLALDSAGNVFVVDAANHTVRKVTPSGVVTTLGGLPLTSGNLDGIGSAARFNYPSSVAVDAAGTLYIADTFNNTIRKGYVPLVIVSSGSGFGFSGGKFGFDLTGPEGPVMVVEGTSDMTNWLPLWTNTSPGRLSFSDPESGIQPSRFYRVHTK